MVFVRGRRTSAARIFVACTLAASVVACSGDDSTGPTTSVTVVAPACAARAPVLRVDLIAQAVAAVEAQLGGPQQYFEINATELLVNLFVAEDDGKQVRPFVFVAGELSSRDPEAVDQGRSFAAATLDFDPQKVTSCVADQLPQSQATAFEVLGGPGGAVAYSIIVNSPEGGQLVVLVTAVGQILSVDPV